MNKIVKNILYLIIVVGSVYFYQTLSPTWKDLFGGVMIAFGCAYFVNEIDKLIIDIRDEE